MKKKLIERYLDKNTIVEVYAKTTKQNVETKDEKRIAFDNHNMDHQIAYLLAKTNEQHNLIKDLTASAFEDHRRAMIRMHDIEVNIFDTKVVFTMVLFLMVIGAFIIGIALK